MLFQGSVRYSSESWGGRANAEGLDLEQINEFGLDTVASAFIEKHHQEIFFRKHDDWSSEHEYRWVLVEHGVIPVYIDITGCITGIVLGDSFPAARLRAAHRLAESCGGIDVLQVRFRNGGVLILPSSLPIGDTRSYRRSGTLKERFEALAGAEAEAAAASAEAEEFTRPLLDQLRRLIEQVRIRSAALPDVRVELIGRSLAVPPADRRRRPGVPTFESDYDTGAMCVITDASRPIELVAGAAIQSLDTGRPRLHAAYTLRDLRSADGETELWRAREESERDLAVACEALAAMAGAMLGLLPEALDAFDELRIQSPT